MKAEKVLTAQDISDCVHVYIDQVDKNFLILEEQQCIATVYNHMQNAALIRCVRIDGKIRAWILARITKSELTGRNHIIQLYYGSDLTGILAVKAVQCLHQYLMESAERLKIFQVISQGSFEDKNCTFTRILGKMGWKVKTFCAIWYSSHDPYGLYDPYDSQQGN